VQFRQLHALRRSGYSSSSEGFLVDSASIAWAFQSDCQDDLLNSVLPLEPTWSEMQKLGIGLWYTNVSQLRTWVCGYQQSDASELCIGFFVGIELSSELWFFFCGNRTMYFFHMVLLRSKMDIKGVLNYSIVLVN